MSYIASCCVVWAQDYREFIQACWAGRHALVDGLNTNELIVILQSFGYWWRALRSRYEAPPNGHRVAAQCLPGAGAPITAQAPSTKMRPLSVEPVRRYTSGWYSGELCHSLVFVMLSNSMTIAPIGDQLPSATSTLVP